MISVASLLNPVNSELPSTLPASSPSATYSSPLSPYDSPSPSRVLEHKQKMAKDRATFAEGRSNDVVRYPPHEDLDESSLREVEKFRISQFGEIKESSRHIPYNSDKKNFLEKTGRESFEVFFYDYQLVGEDKKYTVMWDYNIGLVRITPFFKTLLYSKTTPAKMLNLNPGLKEITHSITGGALIAQGYWMPYSCALAVCATFCADISGALIPIFGQDFPSKCTPNPHRDYKLMVINPNIIASATAEAEIYRQQCATPSPSSKIMRLDTPNPRERFQDVESLGPLSQRLRLKHTFTNSSMYSTDAEMSDASMSSGDPNICSPATPASAYTSSGWTADNESSKLGPIRTPLPSYVTSPASNSRHGHRITVSYYNHPNPWLSVIPRSVADTVESETVRAPSAIRSMSPVLRHSSKYAEPMDIDVGYDAEDSASEWDGLTEQNTTARDYTELEKQAALALMQLRMAGADWDMAAGRNRDTGVASSTRDEEWAKIRTAARGPETTAGGSGTATNGGTSDAGASSDDAISQAITGTALYIHTEVTPYFEQLEVISPKEGPCAKRRRAASL